MLADALTINVPYSEYVLPLLIGIGVGVLAITAGKIAGRALPGTNAKLGPTPPDNHKEYDPFEQGSESEQRRSHRRLGNPVEVYLAFPGQKERPLRAWVMDRSMGGICLMASDDITAGVILSLLPTNAPQMTPWMDVEVRSCRLTSEGYEVGCQWVKTPAWSILLMFG